MNAPLTPTTNPNAAERDSIMGEPSTETAADGQTAENAVWYYDDPYPAVSEIRDHVAFYPNRVDAIEVG